MELQLLACGLLLLTSLAAPASQKLPVSTAMLYLVAGVVISPLGLGWLNVDLAADAAQVEVLAEGAVLVSLFITGLKIDPGVPAAKWRVALRLASSTMVLTIAALTVLGSALLRLPWGLALVLAATLAPTDPVLAAEIQVRHAEDRDALRFGLSGEAGMNDGSAFPFVLLGLGLMGLHDLGALGWRWFGVDVLWAVGVAVAAGWAVGHVVGLAAARFQVWRPDIEPLSEFIAVGSIAASYGATQLAGGYGFLAVFITGLGLRRALLRTAPRSDSASENVSGVLQFNGQLERIVEFVLVIVVGAALWQVVWSSPLLLFAAASLVLVRPCAVALTARDARISKRQRRLMGWFGIRGVGSVYYLAYAIHHGIGGTAAAELTWAVLAVVAISIVVHGISVTPLMAWYERRQRRDGAAAKPPREPAP